MNRSEQRQPSILINLLLLPTTICVLLESDLQNSPKHFGEAKISIDGSGSRVVAVKEMH